MTYSRRMLTFLLALGLMLSGMAYAGSAQADDVVSLSYYYSVASSPDVEKVQDAINEITRETIGAEVKLEGEGRTETVKTDSYGDFWFRDLPKAANWTVTITAPGFREARFEKISTEKSVNLDDIPLERA